MHGYGHMGDLKKKIIAQSSLPGILVMAQDERLTSES